MITPDKIYLIDLGDEVTWCDDPNPSGNVDKQDVVAYIKDTNHLGLKCRYCNDLVRWDGNAPLPEPLWYGDKGLYELHCGYEGAPTPRFTFICPVCG
jgi:hypothetical protein